MTETTTGMSLLPIPGDHYLDAHISGSGLSIRVLCRFHGIAEGQTRAVIEDTMAVVHNGQSTDRKARSQSDGPAEGTGRYVFVLVGTFHFRACTSPSSIRSASASSGQRAP